MFQTLQSAAVAFVLDEPRIGELFLCSDSAWPFCFTQVNRPHRYCGGTWRTLSKDQRPSGLCELVTHTPGHYHWIYSETTEEAGVLMPVNHKPSPQCTPHGLSGGSSKLLWSQVTYVYITDVFFQLTRQHIVCECPRYEISSRGFTLVSTPRIILSAPHDGSHYSNLAQTLINDEHLPEVTVLSPRVLVPHEAVTRPTTSCVLKMRVVRDGPVLVAYVTSGAELFGVGCSQLPGKTGN